MKYVIILGDGMADEPLDSLGGKTPLEAANTPAMDALAQMGTLGMVRTVPLGMKPGSDVANLAVLGYDPSKKYSGRSPLEALSVGVPMEASDVILRCNLVTVTEEEPYANKRILDHSSGEISTEDADVLMDALRAAFQNDTFQLYTGTSYRHILVWKQGTVQDFYQPHDHLGEVIGPYLPQEQALRNMMERSYDILNNHPLNMKRAKEGKNKANSMWFWGAGTKPQLQSFVEKTKLQGTMISAVDLLKGIAVGAGMSVAHVDGATGSLDTNYRGKAQAAIHALLQQGQDFAYVHIEAPDEMGHQGNAAHKITSIERIDSQVVRPIQEALDRAGEPYRLLVLPDHPTPIRCRTHTADPVPFVLYDSTVIQKGAGGYNEKNASATGIFVPDGDTLFSELIGG